MSRGRGSGSSWFSMHGWIGMASTERRTTFAVLGLLLVVLAGTATVRASAKPLWFDELFTVYLSRLEPGTLWRALSSGADLNPPGFYLLVKMAHVLFDEGPIASRLPSIVGFLLMTATLFAWQRREGTLSAALVVALVPSLSTLWWMAFEVRTYATLGACGAIAVACWHMVGDRRRRLALVGMAAGIAGAISQHYYGCALPIALAAGELVRTRNRRVVDIPVWVGLSAGLLPVL